MLNLRPKSVCAVEMTMYVHWTCINRNRKDDHASMISVNGKYVLRIWVYSTVLNKMKPQLCFFLKNLL